jgi:predicted acylesterase/phospholipase RssA
MSMVDAALASSAAPTYFSSVTVTDGEFTYDCVDGAFCENCPVGAARRFATANYKRRKMGEFNGLTLLSIGTGDTLESPDTAAQLGRAGKIGWGVEAPRFLIKAATETALSNIKSDFDGTNSQFHRFQTTITQSESQMDDPSQIRLMRDKASRKNFGASQEYRTFVDLHIRPIYEESHNSDFSDTSSCDTIIS